MARAASTWPSAAPTGRSWCSIATAACARKLGRRCAGRTALHQRRSPTGRSWWPIATPIRSCASIERKLLQALGKRHWPSLDAPFNHPTAAAQAPDGEIYVANGYGNSSVHRFAADGTLLAHLGRSRRGPGAFTTPHAICGRSLRPGAGGRSGEQPRAGVRPRRRGFLAAWGDFYHPMQIWVDDRELVFVTDQIPRISLLSAGRQADRPLPRRHQRRAWPVAATPKAISICRAAAAGDHQARAIELRQSLGVGESELMRDMLIALVGLSIAIAGCSNPDRGPAVPTPTPSAPSRSASPTRDSMPTVTPRR